MPELEKPQGNHKVNTNGFADFLPSSPTCVAQYCDMAAPRDIMSPMAGGATDFIQEWRMTPGWAVRPEAVTAISMPY